MRALDNNPIRFDARMTRLLTFLERILKSVHVLPTYGASRKPAMVLFSQCAGRLSVQSCRVRCWEGKKTRASPSLISSRSRKQGKNRPDISNKSTTEDEEPNDS